MSGDTKSGWEVDSDSPRYKVKRIGVSTYYIAPIEDGQGYLCGRWYDSVFFKKLATFAACCSACHKHAEETAP